LAPCSSDLIDHSSLQEAFNRLVLRDPEVVVLAAKTMRLSAIFKELFLQGRCHVQGVEEWPLHFERWSLPSALHPDPKKRSVYSPSGPPDSIEAVFACEAVVHRYCVLMAMLQSGELKAVGLPETAGYPSDVPRAIWSHEDFHLKADTGDLFQFNHDASDWSDRLIRRWVGVTVRKGSESKGSFLEEPFFRKSDVLALGGLAEVLRELVFRHPDVLTLRASAERQAAEANQPLPEDDAGLVALCSGHDEPLLPMRYFETEEPDLSRVPIEPLGPEEMEAEKYFADFPCPYHDAVFLRARALFELLQQREVLAFGHTAQGDLGPIAHTIWSHPEFYVQPSRGDVYDAGSYPMVKQWTGVVLVDPAGAPSMLHVKHTGHDGVRSAAVEATPKATARRKRVATKSEVVLTAMLAADIDPKTCDLPPKQIAAKIKLSRAPRTEQEVAALHKMIRRILDRARS
jgi:hypothetical protein